MEGINDYELLYLVRQKDEEALALLMEKYRPKIYGIMYRLTSASNFRYSTSDGQSDLYQRCQIAFPDIIDNYREDCSQFSYYVGLCIDSTVRSELRRQRSNANHSFATSTSLDLLLQENNGGYLMDLMPNMNSDFDPLYHQRVDEALVLIRSIEKDLTEEERIIWRRRRGGYSYNEIAEELHINPKRVGYKALKIKKILSGLID